MASRERKAILCCALRSALGDRRGSNPRHPAPQASALPTELRPPCVPTTIIRERHNPASLLQPQKICRRRSRLVRSGGNFAGSTSPSTCEAGTSGTRDQKIAGPLALRCHLRRADSRFELRSWPLGRCRRESYERCGRNFSTTDAEIACTSSVVGPGSATNTALR
jgi:hypothetical protein